ncbi:MAG: hypothetical protein ACR2HH_02320 [Chthoniobacterales bacterium]
MSSHSVFDLRIPLGYLFVLVGVLLLAAGLSAPPEANARSLGININLLWSGVLITFGAICLFLAKRAAHRRIPNETL